jgi:hypothetical protein
MKPSWTVVVVLMLQGALTSQAASTPQLNHATNISRLRLNAEPKVSIHRPITIRERKVTVPIELGHVPLNNYKVMEKSGSAWKVSAGALQVTGGKTNLITQEGQATILLPQIPVVPQALTRDKNLFPGLMVLNRKTGRNGATEALQGRLFLRARQTPLPWDDQLKAYATTLVVGLDLAGQPRSIPLDPPVAVEFFPSGASVAPTRMTITRSGTQGYQEVVIQCSAAQDSLAVAARSDMGEVNHPLTVVPRLAVLAIRHQASKPFGFGMATINLTLVRLAEDGAELKTKDGLTVHLETDPRGLLSSPRVEIPSHASSATVELRSSGLGHTTITARAGGVEAKDVIKFIFPSGFILATLLGGAVGGWGRCMRHNVRSSRKRRRWVGEGCLVGVVTVAAVTAGLMLGTVSFPAMGTELGAFVMSALSGYVGAPLLDRLAERAFPSPPPQEPPAP